MKIVVDLIVTVSHKIRIANRQVISANTLGVMRELDALLYRGMAGVHHHRNTALALVNYDFCGTFTLLGSERPELAHEVAAIDAV